MLNIFGEIFGKALKLLKKLNALNIIRLGLLAHLYLLGW